MPRTSVLDNHHHAIQELIQQRVGRDAMARQMSRIVGQWVCPIALSRYIVRRNLRDCDEGVLNKNTRGPAGNSVDYQDLPEDIQSAIAEMMLCSSTDSSDTGSIQVAAPWHCVQLAVESTPGSHGGDCPAQKFVASFIDYVSFCFLLFWLRQSQHILCHRTERVANLLHNFMRLFLRYVEPMHQMFFDIARLHCAFPSRFLECDAIVRAQIDVPN